MSSSARNPTPSGGVCVHALPQPNFAHNSNHTSAFFSPVANQTTILHDMILASVLPLILSTVFELTGTAVS